MRNNAHQDRQRQALISSITALLHDLKQLAPHPDQPQNIGPLFIKSNHNFKIANDHDGMLGTVILESVLGTAFAEAVSDSLGSWTQDFDASAALEAYSEYITEIENDARKVAAHGQGTLARLSGQSISGSFNMRSSIDPALQAFYDDMPTRMDIERRLAFYAQQLEQLDAAPEPRYATPGIAA